MGRKSRRNKRAANPMAPNPEWQSQRKDLCKENSTQAQDPNQPTYSKQVQDQSTTSKEVEVAPVFAERKELDAQDHKQSLNLPTNLEEIVKNVVTVAYEGSTMEGDDRKKRSAPPKTTMNGEAVAEHSVYEIAAKQVDTVAVHGEGGRLYSHNPKPSLTLPSQLEEATKDRMNHIHEGFDPKSSIVSSNDQGAAPSCNSVNTFSNVGKLFKPFAEHSESFNPARTSDKVNSKEGSVSDFVREIVSYPTQTMLFARCMSDEMRDVQCGSVKKTGPPLLDEELDVTSVHTLTEENSKQEDLELMEQKIILEVEQSVVFEIMNSVFPEISQLGTKMDDDLPSSIALKDYVVSGTIEGKSHTCGENLASTCTHVYQNSLKINLPASTSKVNNRLLVPLHHCSETKSQEMNISNDQPTITISTPDVSEYQDSAIRDSKRRCSSTPVSTPFAIHNSYASPVQQHEQPQLWKYKDWILQRDASIAELKAQKAISTPKQGLQLSIADRLESPEMCDTMSPIALQSSSVGGQDESSIQLTVKIAEKDKNPNDSLSLFLCDKINTLSICNGNNISAEAAVDVKWTGSSLDENASLSQDCDSYNLTGPHTKTDIRNEGFVASGSLDDDSTDFAVHIAQEDLQKLSILHTQKREFRPKTATFLQTSDVSDGTENSAGTRYGQFMNQTFALASPKITEGGVKTILSASIISGKTSASFSPATSDEITKKTAACNSPQNVSAPSFATNTEAVMTELLPSCSTNNEYSGVYETSHECLTKHETSLLPETSKAAKPAPKKRTTIAVPSAKEIVAKDDDPPVNKTSPHVSPMKCQEAMEVETLAQKTSVRDDHLLVTIASPQTSPSRRTTATGVLLQETPAKNEDNLVTETSVRISPLMREGAIATRVHTQGSTVIEPGSKSPRSTSASRDECLPKEAFPPASLTRRENAIMINKCLRPCPATAPDGTNSSRECSPDNIDNYNICPTFCSPPPLRNESVRRPGYTVLTFHKVPTKSSSCNQTYNTAPETHSLLMTEYPAISKQSAPVIPVMKSKKLEHWAPTSSEVGEAVGKKASPFASPCSIENQEPIIREAFLQGSPERRESLVMGSSTPQCPGIEECDLGNKYVQPGSDMKENAIVMERPQSGTPTKEDAIVKKTFPLAIPGIKDFFLVKEASPVTSADMKYDANGKRARSLISLDIQENAVIKLSSPLANPTHVKTAMVFEDIPQVSPTKNKKAVAIKVCPPATPAMTLGVKDLSQERSFDDVDDFNMNSGSPPLKDASGKSATSSPAYEQVPMKRAQCIPTQNRAAATPSLFMAEEPTVVKAFALVSSICESDVQNNMAPSSLAKGEAIVKKTYNLAKTSKNQNVVIPKTFLEKSPAKEDSLVIVSSAPQSPEKYMGNKAPVLPGSDIKEDAVVMYTSTLDTPTMKVNAIATESSLLVTTKNDAFVKKSPLGTSTMVEDVIVTVFSPLASPTKIEQPLMIDVPLQATFQKNEEALVFKMSSQSTPSITPDVKDSSPVCNPDNVDSYNINPGSCSSPPFRGPLGNSASFGSANERDAPRIHAQLSLPKDKSATLSPLMSGEPIVTQTSSPVIPAAKSGDIQSNSVPSNAREAGAIAKEVCPLANMIKNVEAMVIEECPQASATTAADVNGTLPVCRPTTVDRHQALCSLPLRNALGKSFPSSLASEHEIPETPAPYSRPQNRAATPNPLMSGKPTLGKSSSSPTISAAESNNARSNSAPFVPAEGAAIAQRASPLACPFIKGDLTIEASPFEGVDMKEDAIVKESSRLESLAEVKAMVVTRSPPATPVVTPDVKSLSPDSYPVEVDDYNSYPVPCNPSLLSNAFTKSVLSLPAFVQETLLLSACEVTCSTIIDYDKIESSSSASLVKYEEDLDTQPLTEETPTKKRDSLIRTSVRETTANNGKDTVATASPPSNSGEDCLVAEASALTSTSIEGEYVRKKSSPSHTAVKEDAIIKGKFPLASPAILKEVAVTEVSKAGSSVKTAEALVNEASAPLSVAMKEDGIVELSAPSSPATKETRAVIVASAPQALAMLPDVVMDSPSPNSQAMEEVAAREPSAARRPAMEDDDVNENNLSVILFDTTDLFMKEEGKSKTSPAVEPRHQVNDDLAQQFDSSIESCDIFSPELSFNDEDYGHEPERPGSTHAPGQYRRGCYLDSAKKTFALLSSSFENLFGRMSPLNRCLDDTAATKTQPGDAEHASSKCDGHSPDSSFSDAVSDAKQSNERDLKDSHKEQPNPGTSVTNASTLDVSNSYRGNEIANSTLNDEGDLVDNQMSTEDLGKRMEALFDRMRKMESQFNEFHFSPTFLGTNRSQGLSETIILESDEDVCDPDDPSKLLFSKTVDLLDSSSETEQKHTSRHSRNDSFSQKELARRSEQRSVSFSDTVVLADDKVDTNLHNADLEKPKYAPTPFRPPPPVAAKAVPTVTNLNTEDTVETVGLELSNKALSDVQCRPPTQSPKRGYISMRSKLIREAPSARLPLNLSFAQDNPSNVPVTSEKMVYLFPKVEDLD